MITYGKHTELEIDAIKLAKAVIDASLYWTGIDETKNPTLKRARTLAGIVLNEACE